MSLFSPRNPQDLAMQGRRFVERLESRDLFSLVVTVPGPIPATEIAGATANARIAVNVANNGPDKVSTRDVATLFATPDGLIDDAVQLTATPTSVGLHISDGNNKTYHFKIKNFPQNLHGAYFILAQFTGDVNVAGVSTSKVTVAPPFIDLNNLSVTPGPSNARAGRKIAVTVVVENDGNILAKGPLGVTFSASQNTNGSNAFALANLEKNLRLKPSKMTKLHFNVPLVIGIPTGNQYVVATLTDPTNVFLDTNLANNTMVALKPVSVT